MTKQQVAAHTPSGLRLSIDCGDVNIRFPNFLRISFFADWIQRNVCALSDERESLPYCPELVCPRDARLLGYPWALLPNGTGSTFGIRGFDPVRLTQWPPPGTPLWRNTTTNVTITAFDASDRMVECIWHVHVPPLEEVGTVAVDVPEVPNGTILKSGKFSNNFGGYGMVGRVYKLSGRTADQVRGGGSSIKANLQKPSGKFAGTLKLQENRTKGAVAVPSVPLRYSLSETTSDVSLEVQAERLVQANTVTYKAYGQIQEFL